ncbi:hypothetical protein B0H14DRAFT_3156483 [Mycena olivaceomarginata]|nr:hypothetical protein B0H14DRAFT_3156483 [Mycena olivaceomarginata]
MTSFLRRTECMVFTLLTFHPLVPFPERSFPTNLRGISANHVHPSQSGWFWARDSKAPAESGEFVVRPYVCFTIAQKKISTNSTGIAHQEINLPVVKRPLLVTDMTTAMVGAAPDVRRARALQELRISSEILGSPHPVINDNGFESRRK